MDIQLTDPLDPSKWLFRDLTDDQSQTESESTIVKSEIDHGDDPNTSYDECDPLFSSEKIAKPLSSL